MKHFVAVILTLLSVHMYAQQTSNWKGGTPGRETSWSEARNWSTNQVPDEYTRVVIWSTNTGHNAMPVIDGEVVVASIHMFDSTELTILEGATLTVDGEYIYSEGLVCFGGHVNNEGTIHLQNLNANAKENFTQRLKGEGSVYLEGSIINASVLAQQ